MKGAGTDFFDFSKAADSTISADANSYIKFHNFATGGNATLIADGGTIYFRESSTGEAARVVLTHKGTLDLTSHNLAALMSIGSLEGDRTAFVNLGTQEQLTVGGNGLSTVFAGKISGDGSLVKIGPESLTLTGGSSYREGSIVNRATLIARNSSGSATGKGPVTVNGTLGGTGSVRGTVTIGNGTSGKAFLSPGVKEPGTFTIAKTLTFNSNGNYNFEMGLSPHSKADEVTANGVTITSGAKFNLKSRGTQTLISGTSFTVISNTSANPISGTFSNLADGSTIIAGNNTLLVSYAGGDGNDLTLTVQ